MEGVGLASARKLEQFMHFDKLRKVLQTKLFGLLVPLVTISLINLIEVCWKIIIACIIKECFHLLNDQLILLLFAFAVG